MFEHDYKSSRELMDRRSLLRSAMAATTVGVGTAILSRPEPVSAQTTTATTAGYFFNVKDYGATGNGSTSDTDAIQAAIDAAIAVGGGIVLFPAGSYLITSTAHTTGTTRLRINNAASVALQGAGIEATYLVVPTGASQDTITITGSIGSSVKMLSIYSGTDVTSGRSIFLDACFDIVIEEVAMYRQNFCVELNGGSLIKINKCHLEMSANGVGVRVYGGAVDTMLSQTFTKSGLYAHQFADCGGFFIDSCDSINAQYGLVINPTGTQTVLWGMICNSSWDTCTYDCIHIVPGTGGFASGINFSNCWSSSSIGGGCCVVAGNVDGCEFVGHRFFGAAVGNGLWVSGPARNILADSSIAAGIVNGYGFVFVGGATSFAVRNCFSGKYAAVSASSPSAPNKYGIGVDTSCSKYMLVNNILASNTTSALVDSGVAPKLTAPNLVT